MQTQKGLCTKMSVVLYVISLVFSEMFGNLQGKILQLDSVLTFKEGEDVELTCFHPKEQMHKVLWYKQPVGQKPLLVISSYHLSLPFNFHNDFDKLKRFHLSRSAGSSNLTITKTIPSDSAVYYCAGSFSNIVIFGPGTVLMLKGKDSNKYTVVQNTVPQLLQPGDSVTLQCTVLSERCAGGHNVYWFRDGLRDSHPGIIYTHGDRSDQCKKSTELHSPTRSCAYKLPKRNLSSSDAGTYYCAVSACGEILFGNGTKLDLDGVPDGKSIYMFMIVGLAVLLLISLAINILLCVTRRKKDTQRITNCPSQQFNSNDTMSAAQYHTTDVLNYAALKFTAQSTRMKRERHQEETLYSGITCQNLI
ncbi:uncharacterized protein LOC113581822 isoform X2 [Electrophorus electricus]|uniref:uncharacterized protein LOC113581822 isoform X2 n=1 Tax=Electrophorus electricus TaxID=8005 RepID=UPI0015D017E7|nr:uncharacterized protein LOC113581822 isoform X2 [Electrophorus electricus]